MINRYQKQKHTICFIPTHFIYKCNEITTMVGALTFDNECPGHNIALYLLKWGESKDTELEIRHKENQLNKETI